MAQVVLSLYESVGGQYNSTNSSRNHCSWEVTLLGGLALLAEVLALEHHQLGRA
jgi:hypothetical protein